MDPTGRYTTQQQIKIIEENFATKLLIQQQCERDFGRNNVPDIETMQLLVTKFQETRSVVDAHKGHSGRHCSVIIPENIQNL